MATPDSVGIWANAMQPLPLSPKQKEVCLWLADGASHKVIAQRLHVSQSTVDDHVRKIYDKLDAHSHEELMHKLMREVTSSPKKPTFRHHWPRDNRATPHWQ
jgi:DNA-binding CsgD family transcriptional regulator